jgi:tetratricopeptide (TPR) repeat protein/transglutaminase-like putative cysteine protease
VKSALRTASAVFSIAALATLAVPRDSSAAASAIHPDVAKAVNALQAAKGPEVYAALRDVWRTWDRTDPSQVEEALVAAVENKDTAAPARVYAQLLTGYARRRRGDLAGAAAKIRSLGFVGNWITVGPFDNDNRGGFAQAFEPEAELDQPVSTTRSYKGKERAVKWRVPPEPAAYGWVDFGAMMRPRDEICAYATTFVRAKAGTKTPRAITLWAGASGAFRVLWNGEKAIEDTGYRDLDIDRFAAQVTLKPGNNRLLVKVCGDNDSPKIALRIGDEKGAPEQGVEAIADPSLVPVKIEKGDKDKGASKAASKGGVEGPMQAFRRLLGKLAEPEDPKAKDDADAKAKPPSETEASLLESFARYLSTTGGDDHHEHLSRDLASRAADAHPTVARLLLAGELAEDRNGRRARVDKAVEIAGGADKDIDILLAQAVLARTSTNWRDAVPIYEKILAREPDNIRGTLGFVELYAEAGLPRTALAALEKAVARNPSSVALLRVYAGQLRALGRDTDAVEAEARYSALRFDDTSFLTDQVELAIARRDPAGAERWLGRFLQAETDAAAGHAFAAQTYRSLGRKDRALSELQAALAVAPEDVGTMRAMSDVYAEEDKRDEQLKLLRQILAIVPQAKDVREYLEHVEPPKPRADEAYAWAPEKFLPLRNTADKRYPKRTLKNLTVTTVFPNGLASRFRQVVYMPVTEDAAQDAREFGFSYQGDKQIVTMRGAKVYRADGKIDETVDTGESGVSNPAISMYTSTRSFYVRFPRLSPGDIVELRYRVEDVSLRNEIADYFGEVEYLQSDEPIGSSEYILIGPKTKKLNVFVSPLPGLKQETTESGDQSILRISASDVAPIVPEAAMPPWSEVLAHVHVSTFKTWDEVGTFYWGLAKDQLDVDDEVRKKVRELTKGLKDDASKVKAVYKYVTELRYVALELGIEGIRPRRASQTMARGWGDCKDKAAVIVTMLREIGIPATMVLVRTQMRGGMESEPASLAPFDHAIAYVPSLDLYLDGTAEHTGSTELPAMDRNAFALQINEGKAKLVRLPQPGADASSFRRQVEVTLASDGSAQLTSDTTVAGAYAPEWRMRYLSEGTRRDRLTRDLASDFGPVELATGKGSLDASDMDNEEEPVHVKAKAKASAFARKEGDTLSAPAGPMQHLAASLASQSGRTQDIVVGPLNTHEETWSIKLPAGTKATRVPLPLSMDTPYGSFAIKVEDAGGKVTVKSTLVLKKARILPGEYQGWRAFCEAVDRAFGQRVVVGK